MAVVTIPKKNERIEDAAQISAFLAPYGIWYQRRDAGSTLGEVATDQEILDAYAPEVNLMKEQHGYVTADVINITPEFPNLDALLNKFNKEHTHSEDEVRFIVKGHGIFHVHPKNGDPVFGIAMGAGDMINLPAGTEHWFDLCEDRNIRAIRLFKDKSGWTPEYVANGVHEGYAPICFNGRDIPLGTAKFEPKVAIA